MVSEGPSSSVRFSILIAVIGAVAAITASLFAFFFSSNLSPTKPTVTITYASLYITGTVGIDFGTNPLTVGPAPSSSFSVTDNIDKVDFTAKLPSSLADIADNTTNPPSLNACQTAITHGSTLRLTVSADNWACVRTAEGATKAIRITNVTSSSAEVQVYVLSN